MIRTNNPDRKTERRAPKDGIPSVVLACLLFLTLAGCSNESDSLDHFPRNEPDGTLATQITPEWTTTSSYPITALRRAQHADILLDLSIPMGGYIHPDTESDEASLLPDILRNLANKLNAEFGDSNVRIRCMGIKSGTREFDCSSLMRRDMFNGSVSSLNVALRDAVDRLKSGETEIVVLISDLLATSEGTAMGVSGSAANLLAPLHDPVLLASFNRNAAHLAILGIKHDYWGVRRGACASRRSEVGCWFDEGLRRYAPLSQPRIQRPLYFLLLSRGVERGAYTIMSELRSVILGLAPNEIEVKSDMITYGSDGFEITSDWGDIVWNDSEDKFSVRYDTEAHSYECSPQAHEPLRFGLGGQLATSSAVPLGTLPFHLTTDSLGRILRSERDLSQISVEVDCAKICQTNSTAALALEGTLSAGVGGDTGWGNEWSSSTALPNRTFGLDDFLSGLRPNHYAVRIGDFGTFQCVD